MYNQLAKYYDRIYHTKNYASEVDFLEQLFSKFDVKVNEILDVACGTGNHDLILTERGYSVFGLDLNEAMLKIARKKVENGNFQVSDMREFDLKRTFDAVLCMFSAINYMLKESDLSKAVSNFYKHLKKGGILVFDTHFLKETFIDGHKSQMGYQSIDFSVARLSESRRINENRGRIKFEYFIRERKKVRQLIDVQTLGLYSKEDFEKTMKDAGFKVDVFHGFNIDLEGSEELKSRDLVFVGIKS